MTHWLPGWLPRLDRLSKNWWGYVDLDHGPLPYQESSRASDVLQPVLGLLLPSVNVRRRPLKASKSDSHSVSPGYPCGTPVPG